MSLLSFCATLKLAEATGDTGGWGIRKEGWTRIIIILSSESVILTMMLSVDTCCCCWCWCWCWWWWCWWCWWWCWWWWWVSWCRSSMALVCGLLQSWNLLFAKEWNTPKTLRPWKSGLHWWWRAAVAKRGGTTATKGPFCGMIGTKYWMIMMMWFSKCWFPINQMSKKLWYLINWISKNCFPIASQSTHGVLPWVVSPRCAFTRVPYGTDVDFGELTKETPGNGGFCGQLLGVELMDSMWMFMNYWDLFRTIIENKWLLVIIHSI